MGTYSLKPIIGNEGPHFFIAHKYPVKLPDTSPGPVYNPDINAVKKKMPAFSLRLKNVKLLNLMQGPGPGEYEPKLPAKNATSILFGKAKQREDLSPKH
jgi:hypothetical protein